MSVNENGNLRPDGISLSLPLPILGKLRGTYYWNPGSPTAPGVTFTQSVGAPGFGLNAVFLRKGMTSQDTLGRGITGNVSTIVPSVTLNGTLPEGDYRPWDSRVTSVEAGIGTPNASPAITNTISFQQALDFLKKYVMSPAGGPNDELSPLQRSLQSGTGTNGPGDGAPPVQFLASPSASPLGNGVGNWASSVTPNGPLYEAPPAQPTDQPGGLPGLLRDYLRNNPNP
ncbi:MAG TPA: hypothetical protein VFW23_09280 [Tepidisphaeraceae bacterium]|nr:hypothetical protein [Tepidisphaeraceae bacterium]